MANSATASPITHVSMSRLLIPVVALSLVLLTVGLLALTLGIPRLSLAELWVILGQRGDAQAQLVVWELRIPRLVLGVMAGAALGLAGLLLQDSLRNDLAGPELIGVSSGAAVVVVATVVLGTPFPLSFVPWLALLGGLTGGGITLLALRRITSPANLALTGAGVSALLNAFVIALISIGAPFQTNLLFTYLLGSLANRTWDYVWIVVPWVVIGIPLALACARVLNILQLGDETAEGLGINVLRTRVMIVLLSAALVAAIVAACGPIGFVALLSPHLARRILNTSDARLTLPLTAMVGATLLCTADLLARQALAPLELPVGAWTTLLGGPMLLFLLRQRSAMWR